MVGAVPRSWRSFVHHLAHHVPDALDPASRLELRAKQPDPCHQGIRLPRAAHQLRKAHQQPFHRNELSPIEHERSERR